eukprot:2113647-Rhodomonas_salina.1
MHAAGAICKYQPVPSTCRGRWEFGPGIACLENFAAEHPQRPGGDTPHVSPGLKLNQRKRRRILPPRSRPGSDTTGSVSTGQRRANS